MENFFQGVQSSTPTNDNENITSISRAIFDGVNASWKKEYDKSVKEMAIMELKYREALNRTHQLEDENVQLKVKNSQLQNTIKQLKEVNSQRKDKKPQRSEDSYKLLNLLNGNNQMKEAVDKQKVDNEMLETLEPLVLNRLFKLKKGPFWMGFSSYMKGEKPTMLKLVNPDNMLINDVPVDPDKKLILNGIISLYDSDPFKCNAGFYSSNKHIISALLEKVELCSLTGLFLSQQILSLNEYEKLVSSEMVKNLCFNDVTILDENDTVILLEDIIEELPNLEKLRYDVVGDRLSLIDSENFSVTNETFKKLAYDLPPFVNLKVFELNNVFLKHFEYDAFVEFIKNHPNAHISISFCCTSVDEKDQIKAILKNLLQSCPTPHKLEIKS